MRIECFTPREWYKIADTISRYCPSEPLVEKLVQQIHEKTDLFSYTHDWFIKNNFNPIYFPDRKTIEKCENGYGLTRRMTEYKSDEGKGIIQFKKDYQKYILNKYVITEKQEVNK